MQSHNYCNLIGSADMLAAVTTSCSESPDPSSFPPPPCHSFPAARRVWPRETSNPPSENPGYGLACSCKLLFMVNIHHRSAGRCSHTRTRQFRSNPGSPQNLRLVHYRMETRRWTHAVTQIPTDPQQKKDVGQRASWIPLLCPQTATLWFRTQD